jgi:hypothetical protein
MTLDWLSSYLDNRHQYVQLGRHRSTSVLCSSGVPQGGVLSALLFIAYVAPVGDVISGCGMEYHQYADDTQLFIAVRAATIQSDLSVIEVCSTFVQQWFAINELLLNPDKSEVIFFGTNAQLKSIAAIDVVVVGGSSLPVATELKSLGVILDSRLSFDSHVAAVCRACNYHIWALRHIRKLLTDDVARTLACSIVATRLDYCNSLLHGASSGNIAKLQRVQNSLARVVLQAPKLTHGAPLLRSLHWLPVAQRITFKMAVITFKARKTSTPAYLNNLLIDRSSSSSMSLRSSNQPMLAVRRCRTECARRAFSVAAPEIWNKLPADIQLSDTDSIFRKRLKTFLFLSATVNN